MPTNCTNITAVRGDPSPPDHNVALMEAAATPWFATSLDPDEVLADLRQRFPTYLCWRGEYTGRYWAISLGQCDRDRLWNSADPYDLARQISRRHPAMPPKRTVGSPPVHDMSLPAPIAVTAVSAPPASADRRSRAGRHRRVRRDGRLARLLRPISALWRCPAPFAAPTPHGRA